MGVFFLFIIFIILFLYSLHRPALSKVLYLAFFLRATATLFHYYITPLPGPNQDATGFEATAWAWAQNGFIQAFQSFPGPDSYFISWPISLLYSLFGRSPLIAQSISIFFGMASIIAGWHLARDLWGERAAKKTAWVIALFPMFIMLHAVIMREAYIHFFIALALIGIVRWFRKPNISALILIVVGLVGATFFHGAIALGFVIFALLLLIHTTTRLLYTLPKFRLPLFYTSSSIIVLISLSLCIVIGLQLPKIGSLTNAIEPNTILDQSLRRARGEAQYPDWVHPQNEYQLLWKSFTQFGYFLFSPFPWDIRHSGQLPGLIDSIIYIILIAILCMHWRTIWSDPGSRYLLLFLIAFMFVFSFGTANFGISLRHRGKFVIGLIALASPWIWKLYIGSSPKQKRHSS
jgi:4-amino-4-deoxy-L-arabinose transferase-like glycosyltransferase